MENQTPQVLGQIKVVNNKREHLPSLATQGIVYCIMQTRGSILGNPWYNYFKDENDISIDVKARIKLFREHLWTNYNARNTIYIQLRMLKYWVTKGYNLFLVCNCAPAPCHGDMIKALVEWMITNEKE